MGMHIQTYFQIFSGGMSEMHEGITTEKQGHKMQQQPQSIANLRMQKQPSHKRKIPPTTTPPHVNSSKNMKVVVCCCIIVVQLIFKI